MSDQTPRSDQRREPVEPQPRQEREVVVTNGGSNGFGVGLIAGIILLVVVVGALFLFLGGDGGDDGPDVPDDVQLDVEVEDPTGDGGDGGDGGGDSDGGGGADDGGESQS